MSIFPHRRWPVLLAAGAVSLGLAATAEARPRADLVAAPQLANVTVAPGDRLALTVRVRNAGARPARRSRATFYLATKDRPLGNGQTVKALGARKSVTLRVALTVPAVAPGTYKVLVCADGGRAVAEANERNNCRTAAGRVTVRAAARSAENPPTPPEPVATPTATAAPVATATPTPAATATPTATPSVTPTPTPAPRTATEAAGLALVQQRAETAAVPPAGLAVAADTLNRLFAEDPATDGERAGRYLRELAEAACAAGCNGPLDAPLAARAAAARLPASNDADARLKARIQRTLHAGFAAAGARAGFDDARVALTADEAGPALDANQRCAKVNTRCAQAWTIAFGEQLGDLLPTPAEVNASDDLAGGTVDVPLVIVPGGTPIGEPATVKLEPLPFRIAADGTVVDRAGAPASTAAIVAEAEQLMTAASTMTNDAIKNLAEVSKAQVDSELSKYKEQREAELKRWTTFSAKAEVQIPNAKAKLDVLFGFIAQKQPDLAARMKTTAEAALDLASGTNLAIKAMLEIGTGVAAGNPIGIINGTVGLLQNATGIMNSLTRMFSGGQLPETPPSPTDIVSTQLKQLAEQVQALGNHLDGRFDRLEKGLETVHQRLVQGFQELSQRFDRLERDVTIVKDAVLENRQRLDQIERNMRQLAKDAEKRIVFTNANSALGFVKRNGRPMERGAFDSLASFFFTHGTESAKDNIALGPIGSLDDDRLGERLGAAPFLDSREAVKPGWQLEENINYIGALLSARAKRSIFASELPNWREWALAARVYARMLIEQPSNAPATDERRLALAKIGDELRRELHELSRDRALFATLTTGHGAQVANLLAKLAEARDQWATTHVPIGLLLGGTQQAAPFTVPGQIADCDGIEAPLARPESLTAAGQVDRPVRVATRLGLTTVDLCWRMQTENVTGPSDPGAGREKKGTVAVTVEARVERQDRPAVVIGRRTIREGGMTLATSEWISNDPRPGGKWVWESVDPALLAHAAWPLVKERFESEATATPLDDPTARDRAIADAEAAARAELDRLQQDLRSTLRSQLTDAVNRPAVHVAGLAASGARALLRDTVALAFPVALGYDDLVRALLDGDQAILGLDGAARALAHFERDVDPVVALGELAASRERRFDEALGRWLDLVAAGRHQERHALIEDALDELEAARIVAYETPA